MDSSFGKRENFKTDLYCEDCFYGYDVIGEDLMGNSHNNNPLYWKGGTVGQTAPTKDPKTLTTAYTKEETFDCPVDGQLILLCLDYLRDLRRSYDARTMLEIDGIDSKWISVAIYALSRSFVRPSHLVHDSGNKTKDDDGGGGCTSVGNDPWFLKHAVDSQFADGNNKNQEFIFFKDQGSISLPSLADIEREILHVPRNECKPSQEDDEEDDEEESKNTDESKSHPDEMVSYKYDDMHPSNLHRFYHLSGLASVRCYGEEMTPVVDAPIVRSNGGPLTLGEIVSAGLAGLGARSRIEAEWKMVRSALFRQYLEAVKSKGFKLAAKAEKQQQHQESDGLFGVSGLTSTSPRSVATDTLSFGISIQSPQHGPSSSPSGSTVFDSIQIGKANPASSVAFAAAEQHRHRHIQRINNIQKMQPRKIFSERSDENNDEDLPVNPVNAMDAPNYSSRQEQQNVPEKPCFTAEAAEEDDEDDEKPVTSKATEELPPTDNKTNMHTSSSSSWSQVDLDEAEKLKSIGNAHMQQKDYTKAAESYTAALKLCPAGPLSHVYFSNRAAALLSMKKYHEALLDSERSLALKHDYAKAHSRLGLANFMMGRYRAAIEAFSAVLKLDPVNSSSAQSYLARAKRKLAHKIAEAERNNEREQNEERSNSEPLFPVVGSKNDRTSEEDAEDGAKEIDERETTSSRERGSRSKGRRHRSSSRSLPRYASSDEDDSITVATSIAAVDEAEAKQRIIDQKEADQHKDTGNSYMATKKYQSAVQEYSAALQLSPAGPRSHIYFANRAAALCFQGKYWEAELDASRSLALRPDYGKAHARLGLSRFFMEDYKGSVDAYTAALKYEPQNSASQSYLAKAKAKLMQSKIDAEIASDDVPPNLGEITSPSTDDHNEEDGDPRDKARTEKKNEKSFSVPMSPNSRHEFETSPTPQRKGGNSRSSHEAMEQNKRSGGQNRLRTTTDLNQNQITIKANDDHSLSPPKYTSQQPQQQQQQPSKFPKTKKSSASKSSDKTTVTDAMKDPAVVEMLRNMKKDPKLMELAKQLTLNPDGLEAMVNAVADENNED